MTEDNPLTAEPPEAEQQSSNTEQLDCPNCGHSVGTLEEIVAFRDEHGAAYCGECSSRLRVER